MKPNHVYETEQGGKRRVRYLTTYRSRRRRAICGDLPRAIIVRLNLRSSSSVVAPGLRLSCIPESVQELHFDSFLQTEIPELLKFGAIAGEVRLYTLQAIKPA